MAATKRKNIESKDRQQSTANMKMRAPRTSTVHVMHTSFLHTEPGFNMMDFMMEKRS